MSLKKSNKKKSSTVKKYVDIMKEQAEKKNIEDANRNEQGKVIREIELSLHSLNDALKKRFVSVSDVVSCYGNLGEKLKASPERNTFLNRFKAVALLNLAEPHAIPFELMADAMDDFESVEEQVKEVLSNNLESYILEWYENIYYSFYPYPCKGLIGNMEDGWNIPSKPSICSDEDYSKICEVLGLFSGNQELLNETEVEIIDDSSIARCINRKDELEHSDDFSSCSLNGETFFLTPMQAKCIKYLYEAFVKAKGSEGTLFGKSVAKFINSEQTNLKKLFKNSNGMVPAWGKIIVNGSKRGTFRINPNIKQTPVKHQ